MNDNDEKNKRKLIQKIKDIKGQATDEGRDLNSIETGLIQDISDCLYNDYGYSVNKPETLQFGSSTETRANGRAFALKRPGNSKDYKSLFGNSGYSWDSTQGGFFDALFSGRHDPRLIRNSLSETVPSDGGFLVPSILAEKIHSVSLENELVLSRALVMPMRSNELKVPGASIGDQPVETV